MTIVMFAHLVFAVLKMFLINPMASIGDCISCLILSCGINQHNFCNILMYMIFTLFDVVSLGLNLGYMIQLGQFGSGGLSNSGLMLWFIVLMFIFYIVAVYFSFQTYKEFKAIYQE